MTIVYYTCFYSAYCICIIYLYTYIHERCIFTRFLLCFVCFSFGSLIALYSTLSFAWWEGEKKAAKSKMYILRVGTVVESCRIHLSLSQTQKETRFRNTITTKHQVDQQQKLHGTHLAYIQHASPNHVLFCFQGSLPHEVFSVSCQTTRSALLPVGLKLSPDARCEDLPRTCPHRWHPGGLVAHRGLDVIFFGNAPFCKLDTLTTHGCQWVPIYPNNMISPNMKQPYQINILWHWLKIGVPRIWKRELT